ncbi:MAG TPA: hypothetical protein VFX61_19290 [Micromonosporaceae bacterium]|nr:hypothetical protein [Micromonosporaceae bacterium]
MSHKLREVLTELADQMPAASTADLWRAGRRLRRQERLRKLGGAVVAVVAVASCLPVWFVAGGGMPVQPAEGGDAVPHRVRVPWMWQATVQQDPRGPATLLISGDGGLRGSDFFDYEGKVAVVGRDGSYRMLLYGGAETVAGEEVLLSPDGRYVAQEHLADAREGWLLVTDLTNGRTRRYAGPNGHRCCGSPVAWSPDGSALLALDWRNEPAGYDRSRNTYLQPARLVLLDLPSGEARPLLDEVGDRWQLRTASLAAFSPDGSRIAVTVGTQVRLLDRYGQSLWTVDLGPRRHLAGIGAFSPDGRRITTVTLEGCLDVCNASALGARKWRFDYLDAETGADTEGPALQPVTAMAVRALGWRLGTDLVVLTYRPERDTRKRPGWDWNDTDYWEVGDATLVALRPGGGREVLLDSPGEVLAMDVARDLLEAGRFGGPARDPEPLPARPVILVVLAPLSVLLIAVLGGPLLGWYLYRRGRRHPLVRHPQPAVPPPAPGGGLPPG